MNNIYIAKDYKNRPLGLVIAVSKEIAHAYLSGKYGSYHSLEEIDMEYINKNIGVNGYFNIIETKHVKGSSGEDFLIIKPRG